MRNFILRRLFLGLFITFFGAMLVYTVIRSLPSSYVETVARQRATNPLSTKTYQEWLDQLNAVYGLDKGIIPGFMGWVGNAVRGNFGDSWHYGIPVVEKFNQVIWYSFIINIITFLVELFVAIPLGIVAATKQYSRTDYAITVFALMGISLPTFFLATILKYVFSIKLGWFDLYGLTGRFFNSMTPWQQFWDMAYHMVLPIVTLMMLSIGGLMRYTRTNMLEVLNSDYIRTARAKGLSEKVVVNKHAFRNTLIPLVSYMSYLLPSMFGGALITETLYQIPGIGFVAYQAIVRGDIPFAMFYTTFQIILTQVSLLLADIMYAVVDPRVRVN
ncbi:MAG TPA: ABC transporter permease [Anaerolineaceae bacterium]|mgnify:FL=1|nr:ABC transporter permease [Anaerolineaceae bacterium]HQH58243.1 ABC transporter permease [Anaerolineaceae bacterium]HQK03629.1 ABC transporter permease [Anaerolineaceae bacterium]